jgi:serine protease AprX
VIVRSTGVEAAARAVARAGGTVLRPLTVVDGVVARVPSARLAALATSTPAIRVTPDAPLRLSGTAAWSPVGDPGSMYETTVLTGAQRLWSMGVTGRGVGVALVDSGVAPVAGLTVAGKVLDGPDISFDSQSAELQHIDSYGHGTHMAGIIAGRDRGAAPGRYAGDTAHFLGMAPDAHLLSVKAANTQGATDVSQVIAAIDWVVQHRDDRGMNIRVLNLSFGTDSAQAYALDPLADAAEVAWRKGIVVVASAGNAGAMSKGLDDPAYDPYLIAVGAADTMGTRTTADDGVASFSSTGSTRDPDLVAPGVHIVGLRDPGSYIDLHYATTGAVTARFFRGSGSSQAAAVVSGAAALLLSQRPDATPDQVKALLTSTAAPLAGASPHRQGSGELDLARAASAPTPAARQAWPASSGTGSLDRSRGSLHVYCDGVPLSGEQDIFGRPVDTAALAASEAAGTAWTGGSWNGSTWSGSTWSGSTWSGSTWSGSTWSGSTWSGSTWSGSTWSGSTWSGSTWSGSTWSGSTWSVWKWS